MSHYVAFPNEDVYHAWTKAGAGGQPAILTMCGKHGRKTTREEQTYGDGSPRPEIHYGQPPEERTPCEACRRELVPYFENGFSPGSGAAQSCAQGDGAVSHRGFVSDLELGEKIDTPCGEGWIEQ